MARVVRLLSKHWWSGTCLSSWKAWCGQWPHGGEGCWVGLEPDTQGSWALERASKRRRDSFASTLTAVPSPSSHNHPQALIRMWRTLHRTRSGAHVCYALGYPRGRMAGGQDLAGHCTTLSSPHGSLLWTFAGWQGSGKLSQKAYSGGSCTEYICFECCCFLFFPSLCSACKKVKLKAHWVHPALEGRTCYQTGTTNGPCHWEIQFGVVFILSEWFCHWFIPRLLCLLCSKCFCNYYYYSAIL